MYPLVWECKLSILPTQHSGACILYLFSLDHNTQLWAIAADVVVWSTWTQTLQNRLNWSRCHLGGRLAWFKETPAGRDTSEETCWHPRAMDASSLHTMHHAGWLSLPSDCCSSVECSSVVCSFCAIIAAVPLQPQDGTFSVIVLFTIVSSCVTDYNF